MPQLDANTYLTNFLWLIAAFFGIYVLFIKSFLPVLLKSFLFRRYYNDLLLENTYDYKNNIEYSLTRFQYLEAFVIGSINNFLTKYLDLNYEYMLEYLYKQELRTLKAVMKLYVSDAEFDDGTDVELTYWQKVGTHAYTYEGNDYNPTGKHIVSDIF